MNVIELIKQLRRRRNSVESELKRLDAAIRAVNKLNSTHAKGPRRKVKRKISAEGRRRIAAAQRARWAKLKKQKAG